MPVQTFEDLEVWKRGCRQAVNVIAATTALKPASLRDQLQRASISVPSNVAEGYERDSKLDFIRFLRMAKGSNAEIRTQVYIAGKLDVLSSKQVAGFASESKESSTMLQRLVKAVQKRIQELPKPARSIKAQS